MKSPSFQFYPDKWLTDTRRLSYEAKGVFSDFMSQVWLQFQETCSIPNDDKFISGEIGCPIEVWKRTKDELLNPYRPILTVTETNRLLVRGLEKEHEKQKERREKLRENGMLGGRPKNQKVFLKKPGSENQNESLPSLSPSPSLSLNGSKSLPANRSKPTLEDVKLCCSKAELPDSDAVWFWNKCEANGWTNGGKKIVSWTHTIAAWKAAGYMPSQRNGNHSVTNGASTIVLGQEYQRILTRMNTIKCTYGDMQTWAKDDKAEFLKLKTRRDELKKILGITI